MEFCKYVYLAKISLHVIMNNTSFEHVVLGYEKQTAVANTFFYSVKRYT